MPEQALAYYRATFDPARADPRAELMQDQAQYFSGEYRYRLVPGAGHFLHREQPAEVNRRVLDWLAHRDK